MTSQPSDAHASAPEWDRQTVEQALAHLNRCHQPENLRLARLAQSEDGFGATQGSLTRAYMAGLDEQGVDFLAESDGGPLVLRLAFEWPAPTLQAVGDELRRLYRLAGRLPQ
jgi:hypothetical protein